MNNQMTSSNFYEYSKSVILVIEKEKKGDTLESIIFLKYNKCKKESSFPNSFFEVTGLLPN